MTSTSGQGANAGGAALEGPPSPSDAHAPARLPLIGEPPVRVYRYGLLPPTMGSDLIDDQIRGAHRYQNVLIEIERSRRSAVDDVVSRTEAVAPILARIATLEAAVEAHRQALAAPRGAVRARGSVSDEQRTRARDLRERVRAERTALKLARAALRTDSAIRTQMTDIVAAHNARAKEARAACGLYWGTYLLVEQAVDAARRRAELPRFCRWTGEGAVGVQIQHGMSVETLSAGTDTRMRVDLTPRPVPGRAGKARPRVRLRIGSTPARAPVWAEWPMIFHRPLPEGAQVRAAKVVRRRVCGRDEWSLHVTVTSPPGPRVVSEPLRLVAVDLGWRHTGDTMRAGGWSDGGPDQDILLDPSVPAELQRVADIRSIRDRALNAVKARLVAWRESVETLPAEHHDALRHLSQWQSPARFASLARWWRSHRLEDDAPMVSALEDWRKQDRHLWLWETHGRRGALGRRREQYRRMAAQLASRYDTLVIERLALNRTRAIPQCDEERRSNPRGRRQQMQTAPSELRATLVSAFRARGKPVVSVPAGGPASALWKTARDRSPDVEIVGGVRESRFARIGRREAAQAGVEQEPA